MHQFHSVERTVEQTLLGCTVACNVRVLSPSLRTALPIYTSMCCPHPLLHPLPFNLEHNQAWNGKASAAAEIVQCRAPSQSSSTHFSRRERSQICPPSPPALISRGKPRLDTQLAAEYCGPELPLSLSFLSLFKFQACMRVVSNEHYNVTQRDKKKRYFRES